MADPSKIKPPPPVLKKTSTGEERDVAVRPTVKDVDPRYDADLPRDKTRVDFREQEFARVIRNKGYYLRWRKAMMCVCANAETEQVSVNCDICDGSGFFYIDPQEVQAIMTGFTRQTDIYSKPGKWLYGETSITVEPQYRIGYRDSLEMIDSVAIFNEWITKGNRRGIRSALPDGVDSARYRIFGVNALMYLDANRTAVRLEEGFHFKVNANGWIEWTPEGNKIPDGTFFSLHYEFHPVYLVVSHPHVLRDTVSALKRPRQTVLNLPLQAAVRLDYLLDDVVTPLPVTGGL